jgi:negative regulator of sigma E activity
MSDAEYQRLLEASWRRELTPDEQARLQIWLAARPEVQPDWQAEAALNGVLRKLPDAPLASNFTARVLRAVEAEQARRARRSPLAAWWEDWARVFAPKAAWAAVALLLGLAAWQEYRFLNRTSLAHELAKIPVSATLPSPDILRDFDSIRELSHLAVAAGGTQVSDKDLLTALE